MKYQRIKFYVSLQETVPRELSTIYKVDDIWENNQGYKVAILDWGEHEVWLYYYANSQRTSWKHLEFLDQYKKVA